MYAKCHSIEDAAKVFDGMPERNAVAWTTLIAGRTQCGSRESVPELFFRMQVEGFWPNPLTFSGVLAAAAADRAIEQGKRVHGQLIKFGYRSTVFVCNSLINMYSKCGQVEESVLVFERMENRDAVSWNSMIAGLVSNGRDLEALQHFYQMRLLGVKPTQLSFATVVKLCANLKQLDFARQLHSCVAKEGYGSDGNIMTALMVVYSKCNKLEDAYALFSSMEGARNVVSWTAIISGYIQNGDAARAAVLFGQMRKDYVEPNDFTYSVILTTSPTISPFEIHAQVIKSNYQHAPSVGTALLAAYSKIGNTRDALSIFVRIEDKDIVAWSAMLACYAQAGDCEGAVKLFEEMGKKKVRPNEFTLSSVINASTCPTAAADQGKQFHAISIKYRYHNFLCVSSALLTMYAKKGCIESAQKVFERQLVRDLVSWNSMVSGFAQHGYGKKALKIFKQMEDQGMEMDGITFIGVLSACTHAGLVEEGRRNFDSMVKDHQISPTDEHYSCMVDLYSRAGKLEEAMSLVQGMPYPAGTTVWRTLLSACRLHKNIELGKLAAEKLITMEPQDSAAYVLLSNIYATARRWDERASVRKLMDERKVKKEAGRSWIQVKNKVHSFVASDRVHPMSDKIYEKLEDMLSRLKGEGYKPDTEYVLHEMEEEQKEDMLFRHSEKLALAFGLMVTPECAPIHIVKNLRICGDCHTVMKMVSDVEGREIVVRDSTRFHHFMGGSCSCGDYW
ncbi:Pentatricopeptide repeat-containing protein [Ananas comosus]|nr:Pentatricopeptide repeat-containing protein [Ananas comosus]